MILFNWMTASVTLLLIIHSLTGTEMPDISFKTTPALVINLSENVTKAPLVKKLVTEQRSFKLSTGGYQSHWIPIRNPKHTFNLHQTQLFPLRTDMAKMSSEATQVNVMPSKLPIGYTMSSGYSMSSGNGMNFHTGGYHHQVGSSGIPSNLMGSFSQGTHERSSSSFGDNTGSMRCGPICSSSRNYFGQFSTHSSNANGRPSGGSNGDKPAVGTIEEMHAKYDGGNLIGISMASGGYTSASNGGAAFVGYGGNPEGVSAPRMQTLEGNYQLGNGKYSSSETRESAEEYRENTRERAEDHGGNTRERAEDHGGNTRASGYGSQNSDGVSGSGANYATQTREGIGKVVASGSVLTVGYEGGHAGSGLAGNNLSSAPSGLGNGYGGDEDLNPGRGDMHIGRDAFSGQENNQYSGGQTGIPSIGESREQDIGAKEGDLSQIPSGNYQSSTQVVQNSDGSESERNAQGDNHRSNFESGGYMESSMGGGGPYAMNSGGGGSGMHRESSGLSDGNAFLTLGGNDQYRGGEGDQSVRNSPGSPVDAYRGDSYGSGYMISIGSTGANIGNGGGGSMLPSSASTEGGYTINSGSVATTAYNAGSAPVQSRDSVAENEYGSTSGAFTNGGPLAEISGVALSGGGTYEGSTFGSGTQHGVLGELESVSNGAYMGGSREGNQHDRGTHQHGFMAFSMNSGSYGSVGNDLGRNSNVNDGYHASGGNGYLSFTGNNEYGRPSGNNEYGSSLSGHSGYGSVGDGGGYAGNSGGGGGYGESSTVSTEGERYEGSSSVSGGYLGSNIGGGGVGQGGNSGGGNGYQHTHHEGGEQQKTPNGGNQQNVPLYGGNQQNVPLYGDSQQNIPLYGGNQQNIPLYGGNQQNIPLYGGNQQNIPLYGGSTYGNPSAGGRDVSDSGYEDRFEGASVHGYENRLNGGRFESAGADGAKYPSEGGNGHGKKSASAVHESSSAGLLGTGYGISSVSMGNYMASNSNGQQAINKAPCNKEGSNYAIRPGSLNTGSYNSGGATQRTYNSQFERTSLGNTPIYRANVDSILTPRSGFVMGTSQSKAISYNSEAPSHLIPNVHGVFKPGTIYARAFPKKAIN